MANLFPPVEPRSIIGTGMAADPESIEALQDTWAARDRASSLPPKKKFQQVLKETSSQQESRKKIEQEEGKPALKERSAQELKSSSDLYRDSLRAVVVHNSSENKVFAISSWLCCVMC